MPGLKILIDFPSVRLVLLGDVFLEFFSNSENCCYLVPALISVRRTGKGYFGTQLVISEIKRNFNFWTAEYFTILDRDYQSVCPNCLLYLF